MLKELLKDNYKILVVIFFILILVLVLLFVNINKKSKIIICMSNKQTMGSYTSWV